MIANTAEARRTTTSACPTGSILRARGARDSGTKRWVRTSAAIPTGMLIQKIARHETSSTSSPPTIGPNASDSPITPPHTPMACARSRGSSNVLRMIDIATGLSIEPPIPCSIRATMRSPTFGATLQSAEPSVKSVSPILNIRARPIRSAVEPESISRLASTSV
jgi:hypothetical protein